MNQSPKQARAKTNRSLALRVSAISVAVNALLALFKLVFGLVDHSEALISDAANSGTDVLFTLIVMVGVALSSRASDKDHTYGHERQESIAAVLLSVILFAVGVGTGLRGIEKVIASAQGQEPIPGFAALIVAAVSAITKEIMFRYTRSAAKKTNSSALMADAWNHRSDVLASAGGFVGILGARLGFPIMDPLAAVVICLFILRAAAEVFMDAMNRLVDKSCDKETLSNMRSVILSTPGVLGVDVIKTRIFGPRVYVDIEIACDGGLTLHESHAIAEAVHDRVEQAFEDVKHCMVHVNPHCCARRLITATEK